MPDFWGQIGDQRVYVTAVLERTVVYVDGSERRLTKRENCFVDPGDIELREVTTSISWRSRGKAVAAASAAKAQLAATKAASEDEEEAEEPEDAAIEDLESLDDDEDDGDEDADNEGAL